VRQHPDCAIGAPSHSAANLGWSCFGLSVTTLCMWFLTNLLLTIPMFLQAQVSERYIRTMCLALRHQIGGRRNKLFRPTAPPHWIHWPPLSGLRATTSACVSKQLPETHCPPISTEAVTESPESSLCLRILLTWQGVYIEGLLGRTVFSSSHCSLHCNTGFSSLSRFFLAFAFSFRLPEA
jgi:hypothetical protein